MISTQDYTAAVGYEHRRRNAQFFTPLEIASFMVNWVLSGTAGNKAFHDPAFGLGAFLLAAPDDCTVTATDLDEKVLDYFREHSARTPARLDCADYLLDFGRSHPNIVCNPPYQRFQKFKNRDAVFEAFRTNLGIRLSGYTNTASAFLVKSLSELSPGGRLAYILPSEFLNAGYGEQVKRWLTKDGHLDSIIAVECEREAFDEVITSVCIVLYDSSRRIEEVAFRKIGTLAELASATEREPLCNVPVRELDPGDKWAPFFEESDGRALPSTDLLQPLSEYGRFSRGIATGANPFFVLSRSDVSALGLSKDACLPCISKSQQISSPVFADSDWRKLADGGESVFLFSPGLHPDEASLRYIRHGEECGYHDRYITKNRKPWYKTERRPAAPILLNVFSRSGYKVVRNHSPALSLTNFHCFYPRADAVPYVDWLFLYLHSGIGRRILALSRRKYGNELEKFEPNDLNGSWAPRRDFFDSLGTDRRDRLMEALRSGENADAALDGCFAPLLAPPPGSGAPRKPLPARSRPDPRLPRGAVQQLLGI